MISDFLSQEVVSMLGTVACVLVIAFFAFILVSLAWRKLTWALFSLEEMIREIMHHPYHHGGFDDMIAISSCASDIRVSHNVLVFKYTVPKSLCVTTEIEQHTTEGACRPRLSLAGVLALADLATTLVILASDKTHRPGVSISLTGSWASADPVTVYAGDTIQVECTAHKLGATIGFTTVSVMDQIAYWNAEICNECFSSGRDHLQ